MKEILIQDFWIIIKIILKIVTITIPLILTIAYLTYAERKIIAFVQLRKGPNVVGPFGLLQPIADAMKLIFKEYIIPTNSSKLIFFIAPMITFVLSLIGWAVIPFSAQYVLANINVGILYLLAISSMNVYGIIMAGWSSNSKYAFLGAIRSSAQMISYEISIGFSIISVLITCGSLNLTDIVLSYATRPLYIKIMLLPMMVIYFVSILAETNRAPFDLPEAEGELVAGYNVEYSSTSFALFFLGEYGNMILGSAVCSILFMGGWLPIIDCEWLNFIPGIVWMAGKICFLLFMFLIIRAIVPRYRYDQLMHLGWKIFMPISLLWVIIIASLLFYNNDLPV